MNDHGAAPRVRRIAAWAVLGAIVLGTVGAIGAGVASGTGLGLGYSLVGLVAAIPASAIVGLIAGLGFLVGRAIGGGTGRTAEIAVASIVTAIAVAACAGLLQLAIRWFDGPYWPAVCVGALVGALAGGTGARLIRVRASDPPRPPGWDEPTEP